MVCIANLYEILTHNNLFLFSSHNVCRLHGDRLSWKKTVEIMDNNRYLYQLMESDCQSASNLNRDCVQQFCLRVYVVWAWLCWWWGVGYSTSQYGIQLYESSSRSLIAKQKRVSQVYNIKDQYFNHIPQVVLEIIDVLTEHHQLDGQ